MAISRRHFFYGSLLAGAVPAAGFGSTPSLKAAGYKSPNEKLNFAAIGAGGQAGSEHLGRGAHGEHRGAVRRGRPARRAHVQAVRQGAEVQRFPADAGQGRQEHRRRDRGHSGSHARHGGHVVHGARQARLRAEAAGAHRLGSAPVDGGGGEVQGGHADGQPGLLQRRHAAVRRDRLDGRHRQRHRSARLDATGRSGRRG